MSPKKLSGYRTSKIEDATEKVFIHRHSEYVCVCGNGQNLNFSYLYSEKKIDEETPCIKASSWN